MPVNLQDYMLHQLFGSLQKEPNVLEDGRLDYGALPIGRLLTLVGLKPKLIRVHYQLCGNFTICIGSWGL